MSRTVRSLIDRYAASPLGVKNGRRSCLAIRIALTVVPALVDRGADFGLPAKLGGFRPVHVSPTVVPSSS